MQKNKLTLVFNHFEQEHLGKDVFLVPYYFKQNKGYEVTIVYPLTETNKNFPQVIKGVRLHPLKFRGSQSSNIFYREINFILYLILNARKINVLMRFHYTHLTSVMVWIYKTLNPNGKVYVKADMNTQQINDPHLFRKGIKKQVEKIIYKMFVKHIDLISCETSMVYKMLQNSNSSYFAFNKKLVLMPNGFNEEYLHELDFKELKFEEKENIIITVGRLGSVQKNTELFLQSLENVNLNNWKVYFIGPIENAFKEKIDLFFKSNPQKKEQIIFTGSIADKKELWEYYNKAKVFVLTSRWESYALVLNEAKRFRNFLISTDVGAFADLSENGKYGISFDKNSPAQLSSLLQKVVDGELNINTYNNFDPSTMSWSKMIEKIEL